MQKDVKGIAKLDPEKQAKFSPTETIICEDFENEEKEEIPIEFFISIFKFETVIGNENSIEFNKAMLDCNDKEIYRQPII